jgi:hypothetical protein
MNGPIVFSRTIRALDADDFRGSNIALALALVLLAGWTVWLFRAGVPQYQITSDVRAEPNRFIATFPPRALNQLRPGQSATVKLDGDTIPAKVGAILIDAANSQVRAILLPVTEDSTAAAGHHPTQALIEVERVSPVTVLMRAIGRVNK